MTGLTALRIRDLQQQFAVARGILHDLAPYVRPLCRPTGTTGTQPVADEWVSVAALIGPQLADGSDLFEAARTARAWRTTFDWLIDSAESADAVATLSDDVCEAAAILRPTRQGRRRSSARSGVLTCSGWLIGPVAGGRPPRLHAVRLTRTRARKKCDQPGGDDAEQADAVGWLVGDEADQPPNTSGLKAVEVVQLYLHQRPQRLARRSPGLHGVAVTCGARTRSVVATCGLVRCEAPSSRDDRAMSASLEWLIIGPEVQDVWGPGGATSCLVFTFTHCDEDPGSDIPLRVAVDPQTGETDVLR